MRELARMEAKDDVFVLMNLFGEQESIRGRIKRIDFVEEHSVGLKRTAMRDDYF